MLIMIYGDRVGEPKIGIVDPGSAAEEAGFLPGDVILAANGRKIGSFDDLVMLTRLSSGEKLTFKVKRGGGELTIEATPRRQAIEDGLGNKTELGVLGIRGSDEAVRYGPVEAVGVACKKVWGIIASTGKFLSRLLVGKEDAAQLGGPIKIAQYAGQAMKSGFDHDNKALESLSLLERLQLSLATFINLAAVMSVSVGLLNLLPVPVLDGGHLMYYAYEAAAGRPLGVKAQAIGFRVGIVLLASFMLFVTWNDITGFFAANS
jgi:regulator of sigma E protease